MSDKIKFYILKLPILGNGQLNKILLAIIRNTYVAIVWADDRGNCAKDKRIYRKNKYRKFCFQHSY
ncbi:hypothetical protein AGMMS49532_05780 [Endomicrobiia bacterium]|nr:hypothetical protein AGMMS49532_05780 [Endomicrobiia bacterium]